MVLNILDMNDTNVNKFNELSKKGNSILIFHASWCGHCQRLDSIWGNLINRLKSENLEGLLGRVEEKEMKLVEVEKDIRGYPTIRVYNNGIKEKDYEGSRELEQLFAFIKETMATSEKSQRKHSIKKKRRKSKRRRRKKPRSKTPKSKSRRPQRNKKKKSRTKSIRKRRKRRKQRKRANRINGIDQ